MILAYWMINKFTKHSSILIKTDTENIKLDLFGDSLKEQLESLANVIVSYNLTLIKTDKGYSNFENTLNMILAKTYNYQKSVKLEEI